MKTIKRISSTVRTAVSLLAVKAMILPAFAEDDSFADSNLVTGTSRLLDDITTWLIVICGTVGAVFAVYCLIRRSMADEVDGKMWSKRMWISIICAVAGALVSGLIRLISSYYGA